MKGLVLAGGFPQIELINQLKARGVYTLLADYNAEPVAKPYADEFYRVSTLDTEAVKQLAQEQKVDFLITACTDQALLTVAKVSEELSLPCYVDYKTALNVTNKAYMKKVFAENGIPTAKHVILGEFSESAIAGMEYPLVVKPVDCNSSKGVKRCETKEELLAAFSDAVRFSRTNTAVIEEFISGYELSVDLYVEDGKAHLLTVSNSEKIREKDKFVIFRSVYPTIANEDIINQIKDAAQKIADAFGLKNCPMLIQILCDGKRISVIEFSARTGGGVKYILIKYTSGFDVIKSVVDLSLGEKPHVGETNGGKYLVNDFIYCKDGVFDKLDGFEELKSKGVLYDYYLFKWRGAEFDGVNASGDRIAGYTVVGDTPEELIARHNEVRERIRVLDPDGRDIARHDLLLGLKTDGKLLYTE